MALMILSNENFQVLATLVELTENDPDAVRYNEEEIGASSGLDPETLLSTLIEMVQSGLLHKRSDVVYFRDEDETGPSLVEIEPGYTISPYGVASLIGQHSRNIEQGRKTDETLSERHFQIANRLLEQADQEEDSEPEFEANYIMDSSGNRITTRAGEYITLDRSRLGSGRLAPAADRIVPLDHNSPQYTKATDDVDAAIRELRAINDPDIFTEEVEQIVYEVESGRLLLESKTVNVDLVERLLFDGLKWLGKRLADNAVNVVLTAAIIAVAALFGFPIPG